MDGSARSDGHRALFARLPEKAGPFLAHGRRVAAFASAFMRSMDLSEECRGLVVEAAVVHDIGKLYVPSAILEKTGQLNEQETAEIRRHPEFGYRIILGLDADARIAEAVFRHHERLDGSGYPSGLRGDHIRPVVRIIAVADVVESMVSPQVYRPALSPRAALREIERGSGRVYDPAVVAAAAGVLRAGFSFDA